MKKLNVCVEGNVGSGKSTIVIGLQNALSKTIKGKIKIVLEPVNKWQEAMEDGKNILELSYTNPTKYSLSFQIKALSDMLRGYMNQDEDYEVCIYERKPLTSIEVFAENLVRKSYISNLEKTFLYELLDTFKATGKHTEIDLTIYLKTTPATAYNRIKQRNRNEENNISLEEVAELSKIYEEYMESHKQNLVIIQADRPKEVVLEEAVTSITKYLETK